MSVLDQRSIMHGMGTPRPLRAAPFRVFDGRVLRGGFHCLACVMQKKRKRIGKYPHLFLSLRCLSLYQTTCTHCLYPAPPFPSTPPFHTTHAARQTREMSRISAQEHLLANKRWSLHFSPLCLVAATAEPLINTPSQMRPLARACLLWSRKGHT